MKCTHQLQLLWPPPQVLSGLYEAFPVVFLAVHFHCQEPVPVMDIGLIHYSAYCQCDFCDTLPQAWVNYKSSYKCIGYLWRVHDQMKSNKSDDYLFDNQHI